jgi:Tfp pilus assembly protein PilO
MAGRDRIVLMVLVSLAFVAAGWMLVVSPKRKEAKTIEATVATAQSELSAAQGKLSETKAAQARYASAYTSVVSLGKAVPASQEVPSLVVQLEQASNQHDVSFNSITSGGSGSSSTPTATASAGFTQMPFTFIFGGGFFAMEHLFRQLTAFTTHTSGGGLQVSGRLLTIQSVKLAPEAAEKGKAAKLNGTVTATAYVLPASQSLTEGATPTSPTGATTPASAGSTSAATAPAVARVTP